MQVAADDPGFLALQNALAHTYSPNAQERKAAEQQVETLKAQAGGVPVLLQVVANTSLDRNVRQAAAVSLKNIISKHWEQKENDPGVFNDDKNVIRENVMEVLCTERDSSVRDLLAESVNNIAGFDFPDAWPSYLPSIVNMIKTQDQLRIYNSLVGLRKVIKRYEFKPTEKRGPLNMIVDTLFPLLLQVFKVLLAHNSVEAAHVLHVLCKIYWSGVQFIVPTTLQDPACLAAWMECFHALLMKKLPEASEGVEPLGQPTEIADRMEWPWWKAKKWICQITSRMLTRFGNPKFTDKNHQAFATYFAENCAPKLLEAKMHLLSLRAQNQFCTSKVLQLSLTYVTGSIEQIRTYRLIKPHLNFVLFQVVFPMLCLTETDLELWHTDPHEFVRRQHDILEEFHDPRAAAITLLCDLCKLRHKDALKPVLAHCTKFLTDYQTKSAAQLTAEDCRQKDGILLGLGSLSEHMRRRKIYANQMEMLLVQHVYPEFQSPYGFMRMRASWITMRFAEINFSNEQNLITGTQLVVNAIRDKELPVQIQSAKTIKDLIPMESARTVVGPMLPQVIEQYFRLMTEIGNDDVVNALQSIIEHFEDQIAPLAAQLSQKLSEVFLTYSNGDEEDDEMQMAAMQCLDAMCVIMQAVCDKPELFPSIEQQYRPVIQLVLTPAGDQLEYLENILEMLSYLTYYGQGISQEMWAYFPAIFYAFDNWAFDFIDTMVTPLDNYISKDVDTFCSPTPLTIPTEAGTTYQMTYLQMITHMVKKIFEQDRAMISSESGECVGGELDSVKACQLFFSVLHNCFGRVDPWIQDCVDLVLARMFGQGTAEQGIEAARGNRLKTMCVEVLASAMHYNVQVTLAAIEARGMTEKVFEFWIATLQATSDKLGSPFQSRFSKKLSVLGMTNLMRVPLGSLPATVQAGMSQIFTETLRTLIKMEAHAQARGDDFEYAPGQNGEGLEEDDEGEEGDEEEWEDEDDDEGGEDGDIENEEDEAYLQALEAMGGDAEGRGGFMGGFMDDDEDEDEDDYSSPIDDVSALVFFADTLQQAAGQYPDVYAQLNASLAPDAQAICQQLVQQAAVEKAKLEEEARQEVAGQ
jgi:hypothetical protein